MSRSSKVYVGKIPPRASVSELESLFGKYGQIGSFNLKSDFGFVEFEDPRDAEDAIHELDGHSIHGSRMIVEIARGGRDTRSRYGRRPGSTLQSQDGIGHGPNSNKCFNCGQDGHWARDCNAGDWSNRCYNCGDVGHIKSDCSVSKTGRDGGFRDRHGKRQYRDPSRSGSRGRHRRDRGSRSRSFDRKRRRSRSRSHDGSSRRRERDERHSSGSNRSRYSSGSDHGSRGRSRNGGKGRGRSRSRSRSRSHDRGRNRSGSNPKLHVRDSGDQNGHKDNTDKEASHIEENGKINGTESRDDAQGDQANSA